MKRSFYFVCIMSVILFIASCKRELPSTYKEVTESTNEIKGSKSFHNLSHLSQSEVNKLWDEKVNVVAATVVQLVNGTDFRKYLKKKALEAFDGDYDVLLSTVIFDIVNSQSTRYPLVTDENFINSDQINYLQSAVNDFPLMHLSIQVDAEQWNTINYIPPVVYTLSNYDESFTKEVPVVDEKGNIITYLDAQVDPVDPVIIVSLNERTYIDENGVVMLEQPAEPYGIEGTDKVDSLPPIDPTLPLNWYRQNFKYETIYSIGFWEIDKIEGWPAGGPELRTYHYSATDTIGLNYSKEGYYAGETHAKRKKVKNKWYDLPNEKLITTHLWRWGQTGTVFKFAFYEFDHEPFSEEVTDSLASFITKFAKVDSTGIISTPIRLASSAVQLFGLFLPKEGRLSESIGEIEISANNNANEFHLGTGGFGFRSKPY